MPTPTALPAAFTAGDVLTAANMNALLGGFRVLQVVAFNTDIVATSSSATPADTGLTVTITPQFSTSKVLVLVSQNGVRKTNGNAGNGVTLTLRRDGTVIMGVASGVGFTNSTLELITSASATFLDSPATTSAVTYKTSFNNRVNAAAASVQDGNPGAINSTIVAMEISA